MQHLFLQEGFSPMLKYYIKTSEALKQLRKDTAGVVSFEYVIVAACVVGAVIAAFGTGTTSGIGLALTTALGKITDAINAIVVTPAAT
jgi:pilus assembly protein Flp/PilA